MIKAQMTKLVSIFIVLILISVTSSGCLFPGLSTPQQPSPATPEQSLQPKPSTVASPSPITAATPIEPGWKPPVAQSTGQPLQDMADVVARVRPSVVSIDVTATAFDIFGQPISEQGAGSGWIIDSNGVIVTNDHVVEGAKEVRITLSDGRIFVADKISTDPVTDLAVVKINATGLPAAKLGDSSRLRVGQLVAAIGNALGEGISMTGGWVSQLGVSMTNERGTVLYDLIKTDAAINPGNSGGPLVDASGDVIGITSAKLVGSSIEGVGYAISINSALPVIQDLIIRGYTIRPWFGVSLQTVSDSLATRYDLKVKKGAVVTNITRSSPAALAGLKQLDVIVAIGDKEVNTLEDAIQAIRGTTIGKPVQVTYYRNGIKNTVNVTPAESPR